MIPQTSHTQEPQMQTPDIRIALSHFLRQIEAGHVRTKTQRPKPLHFCSEIQALREYSWPCEPNPDSKTDLDKVKRVAPGDLESHRRTHRFRAPSCLCAFIDGEEYTEAQISIVEVLTKDETRNHCILNGEIVAQCARQRCGYLLCLERFYQLSDLAVFQYKPRTTPLPIQDLVHVSDIEKSFRRGDGLFQVMPDVVLRGNRKGLELVSPTETKAVQDRLWDKLMTGMLEEDFWSTFVQCIRCGQVTFRQHYAINHATHCSDTHMRKRRTVHPNIRHHLYQRNTPAAGSGLPIGMRLLTRMDTLIVGDEPERQPVRSLSVHRRAASTDSAYNYDPEDVTLPDHGSSYGSGFETAREELGSTDGEGESEEDFLGSQDTDDRSAAGVWWTHDVPELGSDDSLPDLLSIFDESPRQSLATSNVRTQVEHAYDSSHGSD